MVQCVVSTSSLPLYSCPDFAGDTECVGHPVWNYPDDGFLV